MTNKTFNEDSVVEEDTIVEETEERRRRLIVLILFFLIIIIGIFAFAFTRSNYTTPIEDKCYRDCDILNLSSPNYRVDSDGDGKPDANLGPIGGDKPRFNVSYGKNYTKAYFNILDESVNVDSINYNQDYKVKNPITSMPDNGSTMGLLNVDVDDDGWPDVNIDLDADGVCDLNCDIDGDGTPDKYIDVDRDTICDLKCVDICTKDCDTDNDGKCDYNCDNDKDGVCDLNCDTNNDGVCDHNCDTDKDGKCDLNCDNDKDGKCDYNCDNDKDGKCDLNCDTDKDGKCNLNCDTDNDGKCNLNCDTDKDGKCDLNCDTDNDGKCNTNCDTDGDGKCDLNCDVVDVEDENTYILVFGDVNDLITFNAVPGWKASKTFTVTNTGTGKVTYKIDFTAVKNTFTETNNLYYGLSINGETMKDINTTRAPYEYSNLVTNMDIEPGEVHTYVISFEFKDTGLNQDIDKGKEFYTKLQVKNIQ